MGESKKGIDDIMNTIINPADYTIMVVDDNVFNVQLLEIMLKKSNYTVISATCGKEALEKLKSEKPDIVLLDIMMPDISGYDVAKEIRENSDFSEIPILFLSALNNVDDIIKGFKSGADDYISKPFNKEELLTRINHQLSLVNAKRIIIKKNEELRKLVMERDKFYSLVAHDLRSPIGILKMSLNILTELKEEQIGEDMYEIISMSNKTAEEIFQLLDNLLKWARWQSGSLKTVFQTINIADLINSVTEQLEIIAGIRHISIPVTVPDDLIISMDIEMIKTVLRNLISNAIKFSKDGSTIEVTVEEDTDNVIVHVKDHGCGIKEEDKHLILNPNSNHTTYGLNNEEGSGLGLTLCVQFVEKNHGKIWFESTEGVGSTFSFSIPKIMPEKSIQ